MHYRLQLYKARAWTIYNNKGGDLFYKTRYGKNTKVCEGGSELKRVEEGRDRVGRVIETSKTGLETKQWESWHVFSITRMMMMVIL